MLGSLPLLAATHIVNPGEDIQLAIDGAAAGDTIQLAAGIHNVANTIVVDNSVAITGVGVVTVQGTNINARNVFQITTSDVSIENLTVTLTGIFYPRSLIPSEITDCLIGVSSSGLDPLSGILIQGNTLCLPLQAGPMGDWVGRALTVDSGDCSGIIITGNTVYNTRNGIVVRYGNTAVITNNVVYNTKGGIMNYTSNQADADNRTMTGNTWGTVHNEWDVVWNSANYDPDYQASVISLSNANDSAYVLDRRDAAGGHAVGNRSHIFVNSTTGLTKVHEALGNMNEPFANLGLAIEGVASDGTIYVAAGNYEGIAIDKQVLLDGTDIGGTVISSGIGYSPTYAGYTTAFRLDAGADGTTINDMTVACLPGIGYYFAVFSRGVDDVTLDNITIYDTVQGLTNWGGSGWSVLDNQVIGTVAANGGGIGIYIGATMGYETASNNLIQGNVIGSDASAPDYSCPGIVIGLDLRYGRFDEFATYDLGGNQIIGNTITDSGVLNGVGIEVGVIAGTGNDPALVPGILDATLGAIHDTVIRENTVAGEFTGLYLYNIVGTDIDLNVIAGNTNAGIAMYDGNIDNVFRYNSISGNAYGLYNGTGSLVDAALNWWGDTGGPSGEGSGAGDLVSADVIFSPWLAIDPDADTNAAGVQIGGSMLIIVAPVGPEPSAGYLNMAIEGSNELPFADVIEVRHGTYDASEAITDPVNIISEVGSAQHTTLNGNMSVNGNGVLIGLPLQGFRINGDVTVGLGADASTSRINWSDLYGYITNQGSGAFDAQYNYWGTQEVSVIDARTTGLIDFEPYLPKNADDSYRDIQALMAAGLASGIDPAIVNLWTMDRLGQDVTTFILYQGVAGAGAFGGAPAGAEINLGGTVGGGGAVEGTSISGTYPIGAPVGGTFTLTDPLTGEPVSDAAVTTSLLGPDGALVLWGCATYDATLGEYVFSIDTSGLAPGVYELIIQTDDGQSQTFEIVIEES